MQDLVMMAPVPPHSELSAQIPALLTTAVDCSSSEAGTESLAGLAEASLWLAQGLARSK